jgi:hypothetical protein
MKLRGLSQVSIPSLNDIQQSVSQQLDRSIVLPAERVAQYSLLGAASAAALTAIIALSVRRRPTRSVGALLLLLAAPVAGAGIGVMAATKSNT